MKLQEFAKGAEYLMYLLTVAIAFVAYQEHIGKIDAHTALDIVIFLVAVNTILGISISLGKKRTH